MVLTLHKLPKLDIFLKKAFIISYAGTISFFLAFLISIIIKKYVSKKYDKKKSKLVNILNLVKIVVSMLVSFYCIRQLMEMLPYPLHDPPRFDVYRVKELKSTIIIAFAYLINLGDDLKSYKELMVL